ncbi:MAG: DEAD/DEAH box helicase [Ectothiorhodospiraceae bacterium]|nr:DEAD/DEAH box helicase [Ectothiorhodospiraceae bacterium]
MNTDPCPDFRSLGLPEPILQALADAGYRTPTAIQVQSIPPLLAGMDLIGQAQTGTGKTAAFALPLLCRLAPDGPGPGVLVLTPTRELAIQVAEAFQSYARHLPAVRVLTLYGGQAYGPQLRELRRGAHIVVGTPGRVIDHMRRGTLRLDGLSSLVLDEADDMLRMGFIDDVEWILKHTPAARQVALFSATMPDPIRRVARQHLRDPQEVRIATTTATVRTIRQRYWRTTGLHKLDALCRVLEAEPIDAALVFTGTKTGTVELAEKLTARGHACEPLNGDMPQKLRERTVERLKAGELDVVVATDVAARGLDVKRISHVINYDIPRDAETYVHRIGRTGRAGRSGEAILFVAPREQRMLQAIERSTRQAIEPMDMPSAGDVNAQRIARFGRRIGEVLATTDLTDYRALVEAYARQHAAEPLALAAALANMLHGDAPFLLEEKPQLPETARAATPAAGPRRQSPIGSGVPPSPKRRPEIPMTRFLVDVGHEHGVKPGNLVGAIANETGMDSRAIGAIRIQDRHSTVELPADIPPELVVQLRGVWVCGRRLGLRGMGEDRPLQRRPERPAGAVRRRVAGKTAAVRRGRHAAT